MALTLFIGRPNRNAWSDADAESLVYTAPIHSVHQAGAPCVSLPRHRASHPP